MPHLFDDRRDAGRQLAARLQGYAGRSGVIVLGLPRGGVPVAYEVAHSIGAPLDVCTARKLGVPGHEEFALGAIASGGVCVLHDDTIRALGIPATVIAQVRAVEERELARRDALYRGNRSSPDVQGCTVILVDDGMATGATMQASVEAMRAQGARQVIVAVPVAPPQTCTSVAAKADRCVCLAMPHAFTSVGLWYGEFEQVTDDEVRALLDDDHHDHPRATAGLASSAYRRR